MSPGLALNEESGENMQDYPGALDDIRNMAKEDMAEKVCEKLSRRKDEALTR